MADDGKPDDSTDGPSLEMPSFSLRRRKKAPPEDTTPEPTPEPVVAEPEPEPTPPPVVTTDVPEPEREPAREPAYEPPTAEVPAHPAYEPPTAVVPSVTQPYEPQDPHDEADADHPVPAARRELPLSGLPAAVATGVVVGGLAVLLGWVATSTCDVVRGTSSCGGGPGFLVLLLVLALLAYAGGWLLTRFGVPDAGSTSLLAVGIMAVLVMLFLLESLDAWWSAVAVPVTAVVGYCVAWWVTNAVVGDDATTGVAEPYDVR